MLLTFWIARFLIRVAESSLTFARMMTDQERDPFAALRPPGAAQMPTAWRHVRIPGPPASFALRAQETRGAPEQRFRRRTILGWNCTLPGQFSDGYTGDRLALIDKASPHAHYDLMVSEVSDRTKSTPEAVLPITAQALWQSALEFVRFVSAPRQQREFDLSGGRLVLACNCDPATRDRESIQAAKQFHLHLLYWSAAELSALNAPEPLSATTDPRALRQWLDPLSFLSEPLLAVALANLDLSALGARRLPPDQTALLRGERPPGGLIELPGWQTLGDPAFPILLRDIHRRISQLSAALCEAFTGRRTAPAPWHRHRLRPPGQRQAALHSLHLGAELEQALEILGNTLRDMSPQSAARLKRASPAARQHCMTLNPPCYGINLYSQAVNHPEQPLIASAPVYLLLSLKLFSGIGCAGLLPLGSVPSVRILRGSGQFSPAAWQQRALFQRRFAQQLWRTLVAQSGLHPGSVHRLRDFTSGWC
jgi:hypothetical protein